MPRKTDSNCPADWLAIAESELEALKVLAEREIACDMCRSKLAEVLEKALKAELIRCGWFLEKRHDLERLRKALAAYDAKLAGSIQSLCASLADVYFSTRYPGYDLEEPDWPDFRAKHEEVTHLLQQVRTRLSAGSATPTG